jgi:hypothetical protein
MRDPWTLAVFSEMKSDAPIVSRTVRDLVAGSRIEFEDRGTHDLKGVADDWHLYALASA